MQRGGARGETASCRRRPLSGRGRQRPRPKKFSTVAPRPPRSARRFDPASGEPTHDSEGAALEGKALDKARKELEKQRKVGKSEL